MLTVATLDFSILVTVRLTLPLLQPPISTELFSLSVEHYEEYLLQLLKQKQAEYSTMPKQLLSSGVLWKPSDTLSHQHRFALTIPLPTVLSMLISNNDVQRHGTCDGIGYVINKYTNIYRYIGVPERTMRRTIIQNIIRLATIKSLGRDIFYKVTMSLRNCFQ